ncbi:hypothetical protein [Natrialba swarupiae]|uniref:Uncharacterized protein n=1 Tax=Natrialba swarupiae TaxID=2448032 RepID=A0A5D5AHC7_9EURY|nr:hypothetical protein [Natrialba swarupiae]TYT61189.1 hypothetical protein FYC77_14815 [Natrialba swarupiae]
MSRRQRRISLLVGVLFLVVFAWSFLASLEVILEELTSPTGVALVVGGLAMALGGLAFVIGGLTERVSVGGIVLEWWQFQSLGFVCLGLYMAVSGLAQPSLSLFGIAVLLAGVSFLGFGVYRLHAGPPTSDAELPV